MLSVSQLSISVPGKTLLEDIQFDVHSGEHLVILGANGAGKSTLLKTLCAEILPSQGSIQLNNRDLRQFSPKALAKIRAVMPQEVHLSFPFHVKEVVAMGLSAFTPQHDDANIVSQCLSLMEIAHLADRRYPYLSGGEKQRTQLARVLCQIWRQQSNGDTQYLFLDECTSALDPAHQFHVFETVRSMTKRNVATVSVMHDLNLAAHFADRILILKEGKMLALGTPEEALRESHLELAYGIQTQIVPHPRFDHPMIITYGRS